MGQGHVGQGELRVDEAHVGQHSLRHRVEERQRVHRDSEHVGVAGGEALREWVVREGARGTIEVGLGYGIAALFVCAGLLEHGGPNLRHVAIDPYQAARFADCGLQALDEAGVRGLVEHHGEESQIVLPRLLAEGGRFDLAFVDGNHRFDDPDRPVPWQGFSSKGPTRIGDNVWCVANVVIKGGHGKGDVVTDLLFDGSDFREFSATRVDTQSTHGTGCTLSAAITAPPTKSEWPLRYLVVEWMTKSAPRAIGF